MRAKRKKNTRGGSWIKSWKFETAFGKFGRVVWLCDKVALYWLLVFSSCFLQSLERHAACHPAWSMSTQVLRLLAWAKCFKRSCEPFFVQRFGFVKEMFPIVINYRHAWNKLQPTTPHKAASDSHGIISKLKMMPSFSSLDRLSDKWMLLCLHYKIQMSKSICWSMGNVVAYGGERESVEFYLKSSHACVELLSCLRNEGKAPWIEHHTMFLFQRCMFLLDSGVMKFRLRAWNGKTV